MIAPQYRKAYEEWRGKDGYLHCPKCQTSNIAHIAVPYEGDLLICLNPKCKNQTKIGDENVKIRKGFSL